MTRVALITITPVKDISSAELQAELKERLKSKSFTVERIAILDEQEEDRVINLSTPNAAKQPQPD